MDEMDIVKALPPEIVKEIYTDATKQTLQEVSKIGVDAVKTIRLALFPIQFCAALQDRLANYIDTAIRKVPEQNRIAPKDSMALPIAEKLKFQEEDNPISNLYVNLLSRAMNNEKVGLAHPAFIHLISQLAPDEVLLIGQLSAYEYMIYYRFDNEKKTVLKANSDSYIDSLLLEKNNSNFIKLHSLIPELLAQPELFITFIAHLQSLGVVEYDNEPRISDELKKFPSLHKQREFFCIKLTEFGHLFYRACINDA